MPRRTILSASEDPITMQRFPKKYAITLNTQDYNARALARYWMHAKEQRIPHSRRLATRAERVRVLDLIEHTAIGAAYGGSRDKLMRRNALKNSRGGSVPYDWSLPGPASVKRYTNPVLLPTRAPTEKRYTDSDELALLRRMRLSRERLQRVAREMNMRRRNA